MSGFKKTLAGSVVLHAAAIAAAAFLYASGANRVFITPVYTVDLISRGTKQAQQVQSAPQAAPEPETTKPASAPEEAPAKPAAETVKVKAQAKPSVDAALKKIEEKVDRRKDAKLVASSIDSLKKKIEAERSSRVDRVARLKEEISSRASSTGSARAAKSMPASVQAAGGAPGASLEARYPAYYGVIRDRVQDNWIYPEGLRDNRISVIVSIKIARTGKLLDVSVEKSSGEEAFDSSLLKAVKKAAPFPPLPVDMEGSFLETGLRFCPGCAQ